MEYGPFKCLKIKLITRPFERTYSKPFTSDLYIPSANHMYEIYCYYDVITDKRIARL